MKSFKIITICEICPANRKFSILSPKISRHRIELRQDRYFSMCKLSNRAARAQDLARSKTLWSLLKTKSVNPFTLLLLLNQARDSNQFSYLNNPVPPCNTLLRMSMHFVSFVEHDIPPGKNYFHSVLTLLRTSVCTRTRFILHHNLPILAMQ